MQRRALGKSGIEVSALSVGSWRTFERLPREAGIAVMREARRRGISFLDDARYNDETGTAPLATGYSEIVFGDLFRASGWDRDEVVVANKLWWEFWPGQTAAEELDGSLQRMGLDFLDLVYSSAPPEGLPLRDVVEAVIALVAAGKARAWGVLNWPAAQIVEADTIAAEQGAPGPCAAQLAYSLVYRSPVEDEAMVAALRGGGAGVVAANVLASGALTGRGRTGRAADRPNERAFDAAERLRSLATEVGATPAQLAIAFALANPRTASVLFGASASEQIAENVGAIDVLDRLGDAQLDELRRIGV